MSVAVLRPHKTPRSAMRGPWQRLAWMLAGVMLGLLAIATGACSGTSTPAPGPNALALNQLPWCDQPSIIFQDDGKLSHPIVQDWSVVQGQLGFTPYLPTSLPKGACLALVGGTIHDPIFVGHFRITYTVPTSGPLSFSEAPKQTSTGTTQSGKLQCSAVPPSSTPSTAATGTPGATPTPPLTVCVGSIGNTNVSVAAAQTSSDLEHLFGTLQPNVDWVPQVGNGAAGSPTPTPTPKA